MASNGSDVLVGISCYLERARFGVWDVPAALLGRGYLDCVVAAGALPVLLPPVGDWSTLDVSRLDALVLAGGPDLDPASYRHDPHPETGRPRPERDAAELTLLHAALRAGLPVLGVCRGMQVLNVALGGTLSQHLPDLLGTADHLPGPGTFGRVPVKIAPDSRLAGVLGHEVEVDCHHHQAVDALGTGLVPVAWAGDGSVEAVELPGAGFAVGIQWHPEEDSADVRLFQALVDAARGRT
ncbi:MAG TPA: gamma-glutamyl-gamma-aminobutyrate hydrolase family protein [Actinophytocola sp.]|uniref:gamma-glutamyl-gamma-aminobutyrate hydrolase family protein n=1 Tax=Actinophytocola sp. TaxID=1872138 RepID=UPI002DBE4B57|nr:gamma-glutamyl-gamma-aminobutyrate hydrolase family protein [Actinophytocola sp.]HEU5476046.1 gamma-glutamyl-gamma-aminobutyrate hydrolase family protein [Actinophytocola sp.]